MKDETKYSLIKLGMASTILLGIGLLIFAAFGLFAEGIPMWLMAVCAILGVILLGLSEFFKIKRNKYRDIVEYDANGISKKYGNFSQLSNQERQIIEQQKMMQRELLIDSVTLKNITHKGFENPDEALAEMIGMEETKLEIKKMAARMKFEFEKLTPKERKKKKFTPVSSNHMCFLGAAGTGKAQPLYSKVLTPDGFIQMGDIKVGDKVISGTGNVSTVLGVYPQGEKDIYEITFNDGSTCRCSDEHLWQVQTPEDRRNVTSKGRNKGQTYRIIELKDMLNNYNEGKEKRAKYSINFVKPIQFEHKDFYIHPYLLGLLLGDGSFRNNHIAISLYDEQLRTDICKFFPSDEYYLAKQNPHNPNNHDYTISYTGDEFINYLRYRNFRPLGYHLEKLGLYGKASHEKFIPKEYLYSSIEQRRWLLKGLLDTDGYAAEKGIEYSTASEQLKNDIVELVQSLGGYASATKRKGKYKKDGEIYECKDNYRIMIQFTADNNDCFNLERKKSIYNPKRTSDKVRRYIKDIKYIGKEECQCIYIDDPSHLYITDNYIITHNTTVARIMTGFLYKYHYIAKNQYIEIDGNFFNGGSLGESTQKAEYILGQAQGGVLFIDEAYALLNSYSGQEAIATLVKHMEDNRGNLIIIFAGYEKEMKDFINANSGLESRIKYWLHFGNYKSEELWQIFLLMAKKNGFTVDEEVKNLFLRVMLSEIQKPNYGNARTVRNVLDKTIDQHAYNLMEGIIRQQDRNVIVPDDICLPVVTPTIPMVQTVVHR